MRIISVRILKEFWAIHPETEGPLRAWVHLMRQVDWQQPADVRNTFPAARLIANNRIVFGILGNNYRLIVEVNYKASIGFVRFIGRHADYDRVDAITVKQR